MYHLIIVLSIMTCFTTIEGRQVKLNRMYLVYMQSVSNLILQTIFSRHLLGLTIKGNNIEETTPADFPTKLSSQQIKRLVYFQVEPPSLITSSPPLSLIGALSVPASPFCSPKSPYISFSLAKLLDAADTFSLLPSLLGLDRLPNRSLPVCML